jgi:hypothetical protein
MQAFGDAPSELPENDPIAQTVRRLCVYWQQNSSVNAQCHFEFQISCKEQNGWSRELTIARSRSAYRNAP